MKEKLGHYFGPNICPRDCLKVVWEQEQSSLSSLRRSHDDLSPFPSLVSVLMLVGQDLTGTVNLTFVSSGFMSPMTVLQLKGKMWVRAVVPKPLIPFLLGYAKISKRVSNVMLGQPFTHVHAHMGLLFLKAHYSRPTMTKFQIQVHHKGM